MTIDPFTHPRCVRNERTIRAPIEHVWSVLVDFDRYPEWNPFTPGVTTDRRVGGPVKLEVRMGGRNLTMNETMAHYDEGRSVAWGLRWGRGLVLDCARVQELSRIDATTTRYRCHEAFDGLLAPLVYALYRKPMQHGFDAAADALLTRCEATYRAGESAGAPR